MTNYTLRALLVTVAFIVAGVALAPLGAATHSPSYTECPSGEYVTGFEHELHVSRDFRTWYHDNGTRVWGSITSTVTISSQTWQFFVTPGHDAWLNKTKIFDITFDTAGVHTDAFSFVVPDGESWYVENSGTGSSDATFYTHLETPTCSETSSSMSTSTSTPDPSLTPALLVGAVAVLGLAAVAGVAHRRKSR